MTDSEWLDRLNNKGSAYFALKVGADIVGLTGILTNKDNPTQAILKHGFTYTHSEPHTWNDGKTEDNVVYKLKL
jgi:hypothetical protein